MPQPLKVLIVEDNPADAGLMVLALQQAGFEPEWHRVDTEGEYLERLHGGLDLVLSDYDMPRFSGLRALELLKRSGLRVPFVLVSGTIGEDTAVAAMKLGATDYLFKDRLARLGAAVTQAMTERRSGRQRRQKDEELRVLHAQLSQVLEHSPVVFYALRIEGEKVAPYLISENVTRLLGFTVAESMSYDWWFGQLHPDDRVPATASLVEAIALDTSRTEYRIRHKNGGYHWVEDRRRLVRNSAGAPAELVGVWVDITARKAAEEARKQRAVELERFRRLSVGRELRMIELKREVNELAKLAGRPPPYDLSPLAGQAVTVGIATGDAS